MSKVHGTRAHPTQAKAEGTTPRTRAIPITKVGGTQTGIASTYGKDDGFEGRLTANGETFRTDARPTMRRVSDRPSPVPIYTAAHKTLPFGTLLKVSYTNPKTRETREAYVRVNDRGPFVRGRIVDLSFGAAQALGIGDGLGRVTITNVGRGPRTGNLDDPRSRVLEARNLVAPPAPSRFAALPPAPRGTRNG